VASGSVVVAVASHLWLPESVQFLAMTNRSEEIAPILTRLCPARAAIYSQAGATFVLHEPRDRIASFRELLARRHRRTTMASWGAAFCVLFAVYGLTSWAPTAMIARGETLAASFGFGAVILGMNFVGTLACGVAIDRFGLGRSVPASCWLLGGLATAALTFASGHVMNTSAMVLAGFGILGGQGALNNLTATWYETQIRGTAVGTMLGVGRLGAVIGPYAVGLLQQRFGGTDVVFLSIGIAAIAGAFFITLAVAAPPHRNASRAG
jgi:AAHS family 4-hydroxybenzoate transporter-like MFS transporter